MAYWLLANCLYSQKTKLMKYFVVILLLCPCLLPAQGNYTLKALVPDFFEGKKLFLTTEDNYSLHRHKTIDSAIVKNDTIRFSGTLIRPSELATLSNTVDVNSHRLHFVIDTGANFISVQSDPALYNNKLSFIPSGEYLTPSNIILNQIDSIGKSYYKLYGYDPDSTKRYLVLSSEKRKELQNEQLKILTYHTNTFFSLIYLYTTSHAGMAPDTVLGKLNKLSDELKNSRLGEELSSQLAQRIYADTSTREKRMIPMFSVKTDKGEIFTNKSLRGTPYLIVFSATWCIPCHDDLPIVKNLYNKYHQKGLKVIEFNIDDDVKKWQNYILKEDLSWINVSEQTKWVNSHIVKTFDIESIPTYLLVDQNDRIIYNSKHDENRLKNLQRELNKLYP